MKVLIGFCIFVVALAARPEVEKTCTEKPETGVCMALFRMWYYDPETQSCKRFIYGGCRGNGNRYWSEKECMDNCKGVVPEPEQLSENQEVDCTAPPEVGLCEALIPRYYYNPLEGRCTKFIYGGCGGNSNNFHTKEECNRKCASVVPEPKQLSEDQEVDCNAPPEVGLCDALIHRYFYNPLEDRCMKFIYGGCGGNSNNFETEEECNKKCANSEDVLRAIPMPFTCDCEGGNSTCSCCGHMKISTIRLDKKVCVEVGYDSDKKALLLEIKSDDKVIYTNSISASNPPPVCFGIPPMTTFADVCFDFYDIKVSTEEINYCFNVKPRLLRKNVTDWKVGCYNINRKTTEQP